MEWLLLLCWLKECFESVKSVADVKLWFFCEIQCVKFD